MLLCGSGLGCGEYTIVTLLYFIIFYPFLGKIEDVYVCWGVNKCFRNLI